MTTSIATFAGGCFWCLEAAFNSLQGVKSTVSGYTGGITKSPSYEDVCSGTSGHAEVVQIHFDEAQISYQTLLIAFFSLHDATQLNRQGNDVGSQYRSAIFYHSLQQKLQAEAFIKKLSDENIYNESIKTTVNELPFFYEAEEYHQGYYLKNPNQGYCSVVITPKFLKFKQQYQKQLKDQFRS